MSTANIFGFPNAKADAPRNAFDMSFDTLFTSPAGMLLPAYVEDVKAGDRLKLSAKNLTRTNAVNTAAYMSFSEKVDFFFVPYRLLWSAYNQWRLGSTQARSTTALQQIGYMNYLPCTTWKSISDMFGVIKRYMTGSEPSYPTYLFNTTLFNFSLRMLDLLGYGLPPVNNVTNSREGNASLIDACIDHFNNMNNNYVFNYFRLAAYQCIYMYSYRNQDFEPLQPDYYNVDSLFISKDTYGGSLLYPPEEPSGSSDTTLYDSGQSTPFILSHLWDEASKKNSNRLTLKKLFTPRFKNWRKDLFTSLKPTNGIVPMVDSNAGYESTEVAIPPTAGGDFNVGPNSSLDYRPVLTQSGGSLPSGISVTMDDIRKLSALDKFTRLAIYSDKNYSSLYEAFFGVKVDEPDVPRYLGTFSSDIKISEVVATSAGDSNIGSKGSTSVLGELAGKGLGSSESRVFDDTFKEDGIVMGIHYIMPYNYYNPYRYNPFTVKATKYDYYYPSFDGLGLSPVFYGERSFSPSSFPSTSTYASVLGYNTRYHEYKQRTNEVHGSFAFGQPDQNWTLTINNVPSSHSTILSKISPEITDSIFNASWSSTHTSDPFKCFYSFNVTKVSNMEAIGIPNT